MRLNQISSTKQNLEFGVSTEEYGEECLEHKVKDSTLDVLHLGAFGE